MILITGRRWVANIGQHKIYEITDTSTIPLFQHVSLKKNVFSKDLEKKFWLLSTTLMRLCDSLLCTYRRYLELFGGFSPNKNFYFSYTYELTQTLQYNMRVSSAMAPGETLGLADTSAGANHFKARPESKFVWNSYLLQPLIACVGESDWVLRVIHGYVGQRG